ncbi:hypothetical protein TNCV_620401 [Trichonephila clavipes]|nr:hypothetical protein TNCV_620401 [Trichonephila clavipes]
MYWSSNVPLHPQHSLAQVQLQHRGGEDMFSGFTICTFSYDLFIGDPLFFACYYLVQEGLYVASCKQRSADNETIIQIRLNQVERTESRSGGQSEARLPVLKPPSKLDNRLSTQCSRDEKLSRPCLARGQNPVLWCGSAALDDDFLENISLAESRGKVMTFINARSWAVGQQKIAWESRSNSHKRLADRGSILGRIVLLLFITPGASSDWLVSDASLDRTNGYTIA